MDDIENRIQECIDAGLNTGTIPAIVAPFSFLLNLAPALCAWWLAMVRSIKSPRTTHEHPQHGEHTGQNPDCPFNNKMDAVASGK